jgi:hypothetical protein
LPKVASIIPISDPSRSSSTTVYFDGFDVKRQRSLLGLGRVKTPFQGSR